MSHTHDAAQHGDRKRASLRTPTPKYHVLACQVFPGEERARFKISRSMAQPSTPGTHSARNIRRQPARKSMSNSNASPISLIEQRTLRNFW